jgi:rubrerythrin
MYYNPINQNQQENEQMDMNMDRGYGAGYGPGTGLGQAEGPGMGPGIGQGMGPGMGQGMGPGMGMGQGISSRDIFLAEDIATAIIAEVHAYNFYEKLYDLADSEQDRQTILRIQRDEAKHYHWFTMILRRMGRQLQQIPIGDLPRNFREGVRVAIRNELEAAAFYQDIAYRATEHPIQMHFMHASHDEQRHATLFQNMLLD